MKGTYPIPVYLVITLIGIAILIVGAALDLPVAATAIGAGLFAMGVTRLIGAWRTEHDPDYAKRIETANQDERLNYIADKARSMTLIILVIALSVLGVVFLSVGQKPYGYACLYTTCGTAVTYIVVYQILSRTY
jgi:uncharacterized membrane protein